MLLMRQLSQCKFKTLYRIAKRSATECASIFDVLHRLQLVEEKFYLKGRENLIRIVAMLTKMCQK